MVEFAGAFIAPLMIKSIPEGAILVPIAGVGITWLGFGPIMSIWSPNYSDWPLPALIPFLMIFIAFFGTDKLFGPLPVMLVACLSGIALYIVFNPEMTADAIKDDFKILDPIESGWYRYTDAIDLAVDDVKFNAPQMPDYSYGMDYVKDHFGLVFGLAVTNFIGTFSCVAAAKQAGDVYSPMESMMIDGMGSMLGAAFGSPWGTTVYIGHKTYKKFGATRGYSVLNGALYCVMGLFGLHAVLDAGLPHEIVLGVLVCVGFMIVQQTIECVPERWYPATMIGIAVCFTDWTMTNTADGSPPVVGLRTFDEGYIVNSLLLTFLLMMLTDRWYLHAVVILILMAVLTFIGIMHSDLVMVDFKTEDLAIKVAKDASLGIDVADPSDGSMGKWKFVVSYIVSAGLCLVFWLLQRVYLSPAAEKEDFRKIQAEKYDLSPAVEPPEKEGADPEKEGDNQA
jgi:AGZA family xanthine/uracil permease-like MFS transporter